MATDILEKLSVVSVIWIIAAGGLVFILLFLFAKRQIMRFTLKSSRGPYVSIGSDAPKVLRHEINRRLDRISYIKYEPTLLNPAAEQVARSGDNHYYYRMKAMDALSRFDDAIKQEGPCARRHPSQTLRNYLLTLYPVYLTTVASETISQFSDLYEHARHKPEQFDESHFNRYSSLLDELLVCLEQGLERRKKSNIEVLSQLPKLDMEVTFKPHHKGGSKTKTSIPYNPMTSVEKHPSGYRSQSRYRTRANSSEQAGLLESNQSSQRSSVEGLNTNRDSSEKIELVQMDTIPSP